MKHPKYVCNNLHLLQSPHLKYMYLILFQNNILAVSYCRIIVLPTQRYHFDIILISFWYHFHINDIKMTSKWYACAHWEIAKITINLVKTLKIYVFLTKNWNFLILSKFPLSWFLGQNFLLPNVLCQNVLFPDVYVEIY